MPSPAQDPTTLAARINALRGLCREFGINARVGVKRGDIGHQNSSLLDLRSAVLSRLADFPMDFVVRNFDISAVGSEIVFDRVEMSSDLALIERAR